MGFPMVFLWFSYGLGPLETAYGDDPWNHRNAVAAEHGHGLLGQSGAGRRHRLSEASCGWIYPVHMKITNTGWWFGCHFLHFPICWECHHPN